MAAPLMSPRRQDQKTHQQPATPEEGSTKRVFDVPLDRLDPTKVEFIYDVETDVLTVHFLGRLYPSVVDPLNPFLSVLRDRKTRDVVGFEANQFRAALLQQQPSLIAILGLATIIGPDDLVLDHVGIRHGLLNSILAWMQDRRERTQKEYALTSLLSTTYAC